MHRTPFEEIDKIHTHTFVRKWYITITVHNAHMQIVHAILTKHVKIVLSMWSLHILFDIECIAVAYPKRVITITIPIVFIICCPTWTCLLILLIKFDAHLSYMDIAARIESNR